MVRAWPLPVLTLLACAAARAEEPADPGALEIARIERAFGESPRARVLAALDAVPRRFPHTPAAARALVWRAQLALDEGDLDGAGRRFTAAIGLAADADQTRFAHRGLGDVYYRRHALGRADGEYRAALEGADGALAVELAGKRGFIVRDRHRRVVAAAAGAVLLAILGWFAARSLGARGPWRLPAEALYAAPVLALLIVASRLADARARPSLWMLAAGGWTLIVASGLAAQRAPRPGRGLWLHAAALLVAALALFYLTAWAGDLLDILRETFAPE